MQELSFGEEHHDNNLGCIFIEIITEKGPKFRICHVNVADIEKMASALSSSVLDSSWIMSMDQNVQKSYQYTVAETAKDLAEIFNQAAEHAENGVLGEFGELMVSMGASAALEVIFKHTALPLAELWKPQRKQNEGFDFHTVCTEHLINFGEAKYKSLPASSPASDAASQASRFFEEQKHYRDRVHLVNLVSKTSIEKLDQGSFGMVVSFSMNAKNPLIVYKNIAKTIEELPTFSSIATVYVVGVNHGN